MFLINHWGKLIMTDMANTSVLDIIFSILFNLFLANKGIFLCLFFPSYCFQKYFDNSSSYKIHLTNTSTHYPNRYTNDSTKWEKRNTTACVWQKKKKSSMYSWKLWYTYWVSCSLLKFFYLLFLLLYRARIAAGYLIEETLFGVTHMCFTHSYILFQKVIKNHFIIL